MKFSPTYDEILVSPLQTEEVIRKTMRVTKDLQAADYLPDSTLERYLFNGDVRRDSFTLSLNSEKADSFLPLIYGKVEPTRKGSILFITYSFFPGTVFFITFWVVVVFFMTLFFLTLHQDWKLALTCIVIGGGNYLFSCRQFMRKVKESQRALHQMLDLQPNDRH